MKKRTVKIIKIVTIFLAILIATLLLLKASYSKEEKVDIKSENKKIEEFSSLKFDISRPSPLFFSIKDSLVLANDKKEDVFISSVVTPDFVFNAIGPYWKAETPEGSSIRVDIRLKDSEKWSDWYEARIDDTNQGKDVLPDKEKTFAELIFGDDIEAFQYKVTLKADNISNTPALKEINFNYIDSTKGPKTNDGSEKKLIKEAKATGGKAIPRASWGCPEAYGSPGWSPEYVPATNAIIHHTTGNIGQGDTYSQVRAIWQFHTYSRGWGDIGYNYLIDAYGNVFEGRYGGEDVVAGHAYPYNRGTIGISVMGTYSNYDISWAAREGLTNLMARKFGSRGLDPLGHRTIYAQTTVGGTPITDYWGRGAWTAPGIIGHRDAAPTSCPGGVFYGTLGTVRAITAQKWPQYTYPWGLISQEAFTDRTLSVPTTSPLEPGGSITIRIVIKNTSQRTWSNSGSNPTRLGTSNPRERSSAFAAQDWLSSGRPTTMEEEEVGPGENATFIFDVLAPRQGGTYREYFTPLIEGVSWMNDIGMFIVLGVVSDYRWQLEDQKAYTDETLSTIFDPINTQPDDEIYLLLKARNIGQSTWYNSGQYPVRIGASNPLDRSSALATQDWIGSHRPSGLVESKVSTGEIGTFYFPVQTSDVGVYREYFNLLSEGNTWMNDPGLHYIIIVNGGTYSWQYISQGSDKSLWRINPGEIATLSLTAKNTGTATWFKDGPFPVRVGTSNPVDRASSFADSSWIGSHRPGGLPQNISYVAPGEQVTFSWKIKIPDLPGAYNREYFNLLSEGNAWMNDPGAYFFITVNGTYSWQYISQGTDRDLGGLNPGDTATLSLTAKNTGTATWFRDGLFPVRVGTSSPVDRASSFNDGTWIASHRPVGLPLGTDTVAPGEQVTFTWDIEAPNLPGAYNREYFNLLAEGIVWMNNPGVYYFMNILGGASVQVTGNLTYEVSDLSGNVITSGGYGQIANIYYINGTYYVVTPNGSGSTSSGIRVYPTAGHLTLASYYDPNWNGSANYNEFRGLIEVRYSPTSNALWIINELPLEDYLKGMAEALATSHSTHLRTMAIVERTYAYYHVSRGGKHTGEPFHLKNSRLGNGDDQVYAGYGYEKLAPSIPQAVNATVQTTVTYNGSLAITPYFSRSDGNTRSAQDVWGWDWAPWLISVPDPDCNGMSRAGHGVGLSAYGALKHAERGSSYQQILVHYYRNTGLGGVNNPTTRIAIYKIQY